ncbi:MAG: hypothetical protein NTY47_06505 [Candidatus Omnitrophica bacterium]|nr:hypothetical protein [Candidatus Omnitrophota bacterium]
MEVKSILLCDHASPHPDGTFSLLRGGIDNWSVQKLPTNIKFSFVVILELLSTEVGRKHTAELDIVDADGNRVLPPAKIDFSIPSRVNVSRYKWNLVCADMAVPISKTGQYSLQIGVDGHHLSAMEFQVTQSAQQAQ